VVPSSTQFLPLNRTESVSFHHFNQRVFQQNRPSRHFVVTQQFGRDRVESGHRADIVDLSKMTQLGHGSLDRHIAPSTIHSLSSAIG
jgi:hypothetical protein